MRRHIPGLHSGQQDLVSNLDGLFLVRIERASYRWHRQKPFFALRFSILSPPPTKRFPFQGASTALNGRFGNSVGSSTTLATTPNCSRETRSTKRRS